MQTLSHPTARELAVALIQSQVPVGSRHILREHAADDANDRGERHLVVPQHGQHFRFASGVLLEIDVHVDLELAGAESRSVEFSHRPKVVVDRVGKAVAGDWVEGRAPYRDGHSLPFHARD